MANPQPTDAHNWRKSSFSGTNGECVETAFSEKILVRDSKDLKSRIIGFDAEAWMTFIQITKSRLK